MRDVVIVTGARTPIGRYGGILKDVEAYVLGALVLNRVIEKIGISPEEVDEVIMGQSYQNGEYVNIARMSLLTAGWPDNIPGITIDRRCCTGLDVIRIGATLIQTNQADVVVAGGVESMSNAEFYLPGNIKWGIGGKGNMPRGHGDLSIWGIPLFDRIQRARVMSQPIDRYGTLVSMMSWAETAAKKENISREECDMWAYESHKKATSAWDTGKFQEEVVPVQIKGKKGEVSLVQVDETPRWDTSLEKLKKLRPVLGGVCTAGNSSSENDGAAAVVLMSVEKAKKLNIKPIVKVVSISLAASDPRYTYEAVPEATKSVLKNSGLSLSDMDLIEIQEAFAAQVLADIKMMGLSEKDYPRINVNGSGISLGHPIACTGTRVLVSLIYEMKRRKAKYGLECICGGGGLGIAGIFEGIFD
ncbi:acetyl-CoA C-acetyltransferase [Desulfothermus naphthae]